MASRFTQYGGAAGAETALRQMVAERIAAQMEAQKQQQIQTENAMRMRALGQGDERIGLEREDLELRKQPKMPSPVTLSPGARLVSPDDGRLIAEAPDRPERPAGPMNLGPGSVIADPATGRIIVKNPQATPQPSESGWSIQQVSDPKTNTTRLVRVNSRTGEVQPIDLPSGLQPGGQRQARLTAGQQDELATMKTVEDMADQAQTLGDKIGWKGVGGLGSGSMAQFAAKNLGWGTEQEEGLRNLVGNIQGTIAKLRGGTSFTANEQKLLESYTPTINDSDLTIKAKIKSLKSFIATKRQNTLKFAGADMGAPVQDGGAREFDWIDGQLVPRGQ